MPTKRKFSRASDDLGDKLRSPIFSEGARGEVAIHSAPVAAVGRTGRAPGHADRSRWQEGEHAERPRRPDRPGDRGASELQAAPGIQPGSWLWTCRAGAEPDLMDELRSLDAGPQPAQLGLVTSRIRPVSSGQPVELTFARQGLRVQSLCAAEPEALADVITELLREKAGQAALPPCALHVFAPDSDEGNTRAPFADQLDAALRPALARRGVILLPSAQAAYNAEGAGGLLAQVCLLGPDATSQTERAAVGLLPARSAPSLQPGGRQRFRMPKGAPSRSALKLVEALAWLGHSPEASEVCVDLGAAPGGWSHVLLDRRCHVVAIDLGALTPPVARRPGLEHVRMNAFSFEPELPADWLFCDMAYRPLEVASLLAKWGRRHWARFLVANIKLPMKQRVDMLKRVREILATGGWTNIRMRQLYHDRFEVTVGAFRGFGTGERPPQQREERTHTVAAPDLDRPGPRPQRPARGGKPGGKPSGERPRRNAGRPGAAKSAPKRGRSRR